MIDARILYCYETAVGLGHQRRASEIVNSLVLFGMSVSVASGSFVEPGQYFSPQVRLISLPVNHRKKDGEICHYDDHHNLIRDENFSWRDWIAERVQTIRPIVESEPFDAIMIEWWPFERDRQFGAIVRAIIEIQEEHFGIRPLIISSVRDDPKSGGIDGSRIDYGMKTVEIINNVVDAVLVHCDPALVQLDDGFPLVDKIAKPIIYTGYIVNDQAKREHPLRDRTVIVSCGSGDEGHHILKYAALARPFSNCLRDYHWHYVIGPRMEPHHRREFLNLDAYQGGPTTIHEELAELPLVLSKSGFSISYAGYNTTLEVLASGIPSLLTPKFRQNDNGDIKSDIEQGKRLIRLRDQGMAIIANPKQVIQAQEFAQLIDSACQSGASKCTLDLDGAAKTARVVEGMIARRHISEIAA